MNAKNLNFGKNIADMRIKQKFSQEELAAKSGISRSMLSKIERDEVSPTIAIANKIARGLNTSVATLLDETKPERFEIRRYGDRIEQKDPISRIRRQVIMHTPDLGLGLYYFMAPAGTTTGTLPAHKPGSEKYVIVEQASLQVVLKDSEVYSLQSGDCIAFAADIEHEFKNADDTECHFYIIQSDPTTSQKYSTKKFEHAFISVLAAGMTGGIPYQVQQAIS